jgi:hypothetical protein
MAAAAAPRVLVVKELTYSDTFAVAKTGRLVLPRAQVELCLLEVLRRGGAGAAAAAAAAAAAGRAGGGAPLRLAAPLAVDDAAGRRWGVTLKTWQNVVEGQSRPTFVLERTAGFMQAHAARQGAAVALCVGAHGELQLRIMDVPPSAAPAAAPPPPRRAGAKRRGNAEGGAPLRRHRSPPAPGDDAVRAAADALMAMVRSAPASPASSADAVGGAAGAAGWLGEAKDSSAASGDAPPPAPPRTPALPLFAAAPLFAPRAFAAPALASPPPRCAFSFASAFAPVRAAVTTGFGATTPRTFHRHAVQTGAPVGGGAACPPPAAPARAASGSLSASGQAGCRIVLSRAPSVAAAAPAPPHIELLVARASTPESPRPRVCVEYLFRC